MSFKKMLGIGIHSVPSSLLFCEVESSSAVLQVVGFPDWLKNDNNEVERGKPLGKSREKLVEVKEMLKVASGMRTWSAQQQ